MAGQASNGVNCNLVLAALLTSVGGFLAGYEVILFSACLIHIREELHLTVLWLQILGAIIYIGGCVASLSSGVLSEFFGRKFVIISSSVTYIVGAVVVATSYTQQQILAGRLITGLSLGAITMCVPIFLSEISTTTIRGPITILYYVLFSLGLLAVTLMGASLSTLPQGWRYMPVVGSFVALLQFGFFFFVPESPRWLISRGRVEEGREVLLSLRLKNYPSEAEVNSIKADVDANVDKRGFRNLFKAASVRKALLVGSLLQLSQAFSGFFTITLYSTTIVTMTGLAGRTGAMWVVTGIVSVGLCGLVVGLALVERVGRRPLVLASLLGIAISHLFVAITLHVLYDYSPGVQLPAADPQCEANTCSSCIYRSGCGFCFSGGAGDEQDTACVLADSADYYRRAVSGSCSNATLLGEGAYTFAYKWCPHPQTWLILFGISLQIFFYFLGVGPLAWTINSEIFPWWTRSMAVSITSAVNWAGCCVLGLSFLSLMEAIFMHGVFYLLTGVNLVFLLVFYFILPETAGVSLEDMEKLFRMHLGTLGLKKNRVASE
ncbi:proton myo-inositol cotransporter-like [Eriocheir sinensis]|uniref:proton myo-inositol cotransporter-like n=1 Tax=Eriocheir sinensis TaxID=95602 RepID=UPI0021C62755|nr:proton myo-inositol cotransporter-like [Eriocheir sinensis]